MIWGSSRVLGYCVLWVEAFSLITWQSLREWTFQGGKSGKHSLSALEVRAASCPSAKEFLIKLILEWQFEAPTAKKTEPHGPVRAENHFCRSWEMESLGLRSCRSGLVFKKKCSELAGLAHSQLHSTFSQFHQPLSSPSAFSLRVPPASCYSWRSFWLQGCSGHLTLPQWLSNTTSLPQPPNRTWTGFYFNILSPHWLQLWGGTAKVCHTNRVSASLRNI